MEHTVTTVARVNNVDIQIIQNGEKRVAVKPICQALGIAFEPQFTRLKTDPILSSVITTNVTTGADGKQYEMVTIPLKFVFGWLFRIDSRNVKPEAKDAVLRYQLACYDALYNYFTRHDEYLEWRQNMIEEQIMVLQNAQIDFNQAKQAIMDAKAELNRRRAITEDEYFAQKAQLRLDL